MSVNMTAARSPPRSEPAKSHDFSARSAALLLRQIRPSSTIAAWQRQRNASAARIKWMFTTDKARAKMGRVYPNPGASNEARLKES